MACLDCANASGFLEDEFLEDRIMEDGLLEEGFLEDGFLESPSVPRAARWGSLKVDVIFRGGLNFLRT